jgi:hypothetical protein
LAFQIRPVICVFQNIFRHLYALSNFFKCINLTVLYV